MKSDKNIPCDGFHLSESEKEYLDNRLEDKSDIENADDNFERNVNAELESQSKKMKSVEECIEFCEQVKKRTPEFYTEMVDYLKDRKSLISEVRGMLRKLVIRDSHKKREWRVVVYKEILSELNKMDSVAQTDNAHK